MSLDPWVVFDELAAARTRPVLSWEIFEEIERALEQSAAGLRASIDHAMDRMKDSLVDLDLDDPSRRDLRRFRPLRLAREEAWSDWLAFLLEQSKNAVFAATFFGRSPAVSTAPRVEREEVTDGDRRADIVVLWRDGTGTTLEIKVGDLAFEKTAETAIGIHRRHPEVLVWTDLALIPFEHRALFAPQKGIKVVSWDDTARALRTALVARGEDAAWRVWAWSFLGAIEQRLLGLRRVGGELRVLDLPRWHAIMPEADHG